MHIRDAAEQNLPGYCQTKEEQNLWVTLFSIHIGNSINRRIVDWTRYSLSSEQVHIATQKTTLDYQATIAQPENVKDDQHNTDLWNDSYRELASRYKSDKQRIEGKEYIPFSALTKEDWDKITHANLAAVAEKLLTEVEKQEKANARLRVQYRGQRFRVYCNQGMRDAEVLAIAGKKALLEYQMPKGTTALRIVSAENINGKHRNCSYNSVPLAFLRDMIEHGTEWEGNPQKSFGQSLETITARQAYEQRAGEKP